jgi:hypothetical protein
VKCPPESIACAIDQLTNAVQHSETFWGTALPTLLATFVGAGISALVTWILFRKEREGAKQDRDAARAVEEADQYLERITAGCARVIDALGVIVETMQTSTSHEEPGTGNLWAAAAQLRMLARGADIEFAKEIERICARAGEVVWDSRLLSYVHLMNQVHTWRTGGDVEKLRGELKSMPYPPKAPNFS